MLYLNIVLFISIWFISGLIAAARFNAELYWDMYDIGILDYDYLAMSAREAWSVALTWGLVWGPIACIIAFICCPNKYKWDGKALR